MSTLGVSLPNDLVDEYLGADLGDERRNQRLLSVAAAAASEPGASFRKVMPDDASLEASYRLVNNDAVEAEDIFGPHQRQTLERAREFGRVIVVHDTTAFGFDGHGRAGLGPLRTEGGKQGFFLHPALLVAEDAHRTPLGVASFETFTRDGPARAKRSHRLYRQDPFHEGRRWLEGIEKVEGLLPRSVQRVHVADREGDGYELLAYAVQNQVSVVVRMCTDRATRERIEGTKAHVKVREAMAAYAFELEREVQLSRRGKPAVPGSAKQHPPRDSRLAKLGVRAAEITVQRPSSVETTLAPQLTLSVVQVVELEPPVGQTPVEWTLMSTLPIATRADIERIVDVYRARWLIEEFFKALKTGCAIEKRQHESLHALRNALAIYMPIAWRLLTLRTLAALDSSQPATVALTTVQLKVLAQLARKPLPKAPTVSDAMWAIASLAGHHHRRTRPGWQTLGAAFEKLLFAETVWRAATSTSEM